MSNRTFWRLFYLEKTFHWFLYLFVEPPVTLNPQVNIVLLLKVFKPKVILPSNIFQHLHFCSIL